MGRKKKSENVNGEAQAVEAFETANNVIADSLNVEIEGAVEPDIDGVVEVSGETDTNTENNKDAVTEGVEETAEGATGEDGTGEGGEKKVARKRKYDKTVANRIKELSGTRVKLSKQEIKDMKEELRSKYAFGDAVIYEADLIRTKSAYGLDENQEVKPYDINEDDSGVDDFIFTRYDYGVFDDIYAHFGGELGARVDKYGEDNELFVKVFGKSFADMADQFYHPAKYQEVHGRSPRKHKSVIVPVEIDRKNCSIFGKVVEKQITMERNRDLIADPAIPKSVKDELSAKELPLSREIINDIINMPSITRRQFKLYLDEYLEIKKGEENAELFSKFACGKLYNLTAPLKLSKPILGLKAETVYKLMEKYFPIFRENFMKMQGLYNILCFHHEPITKSAGYLVDKFTDYQTELVYEYTNKFNALTKEERDRFYRIASMKRIRGKLKRRAVNELLYKLSVLGDSEDWVSVLNN